MIGSRPGKTTTARVRVVDADSDRWRKDALATEEPLEIRIAGGPGEEHIPLAVTMRTPGNDFELAAGFLFTEGIARAPEEIRELKYCTNPAVDGPQLYNIISVELRTGAPIDAKRLQRNFYATSSCGVCGKASLDAVEMSCSPVGEGPVISPEVIRALPDALRKGQALFEKTGGIHAAGIFDAEGRPISIREDVGRHNAVDKVIGEAFLNRRLPLTNKILMVSGRASFEIMQKAAMAGIPIVVAVSAPSSLAVDAAERFNMTLVGFLRGERFNVYAGEGRVARIRENAADSRSTSIQARIPMVSVVGSSGSGKTTLIESLIGELAKRGLAVGAAKRSHHALSLEPDGKDSARLLGAGAVATLASGADVAALTLPASELGDWDLGKVERLMREAAGRLDLIIVEGHKRGPLPKIFVEHPSNPDDLSAKDLTNVIAVVTARRGDGGASNGIVSLSGVDAQVAHISRDDPQAVATLIVRLLETGAFSREASS